MGTVGENDHIDDGCTPRVQIPKIGQRITSTDDVVCYLWALCAGRRDEVIHAFFLDSQSRLTWSETLAEGALNSALLDYRKIVELVLRVNASGLILAHNHPSGMTKPSAKDVSATLELMRFCQKIGIQFLDHLIVGSTGCFSFKAEKLL